MSVASITDTLLALKADSSSTPKVIRPDFTRQRIAMMFFLCTYCHGQGHNKETCLKRLTKNCPQHICRDFNRYRQPKCEINGSCLYNRLHTCMICNEAHCKAFLHVNQRTEMLAESLKKSKDNSKILSELIAVVQKFKKLFIH